MAIFSPAPIFKVTNVIPYVPPAKSVVYMGTAGSGGGGPNGNEAGSYNFGTPDPLRRIIVAVHWQSFGASPQSITSITIGGVAGTIHGQDSHSGGSTGLGVAICSAIVPTGNTGNISSTGAGGGYYVYRGANVAFAGGTTVRGYNDTTVSGSLTAGAGSWIILAGQPSTVATGCVSSLFVSTGGIRTYTSGNKGPAGVLSNQISSFGSKTISYSITGEGGGDISNSGVELIGAVFA